MKKKSIKRIFLAGHNGMLGKSLYNKLNLNEHEIITYSKAKLDLTKQKSVSKFFQHNSIDQVYISAAKVGGIIANLTYPADFIFQNLMIATNIINSSKENNVKKLMFIGSSCIYPKFSKEPIKENSLLTGLLEKTNEAYAIAKISGIKLCEYYNKQYGTDFRAAMLTNLYGPNDNFNEITGHVIPALIYKIHNAKIKNKKKVFLLGTGKPKREFLFVDDAAKVIIKLMNLSSKKYREIKEDDNSHINVGYGSAVKIVELAKLISSVIGYNGKIEFDPNFPDGTPAKLLDSSKINKLGWYPRVSLKDGLKITYDYFVKVNNLTL